jgi:hypothetical protein
LFCSSVQLHGQLASRDELHTEEEATDKAEVASHCYESDSLPIPVSICSGVSSVARALLLVCER